MLRGKKCIRGEHERLLGFATSGIEWRFNSKGKKRIGNKMSFHLLISTETNMMCLLLEGTWSEQNFARFRKLQLKNCRMACSGCNRAPKHDRVLITVASLIIQNVLQPNKEFFRWKVVQSARCATFPTP